MGRGGFISIVGEKENETQGQLVGRIDSVAIGEIKVMEDGDGCGDPAQTDPNPRVQLRTSMPPRPDLCRG